MRQFRVELGLGIIRLGQWMIEAGGKVGGITVNIDRHDSHE